MVSILTITILSMISATALYVASQNGSTGVQTAAWQQALTGAESGVDRAIAALNTGSWTNWQTVSTGTLPTAEPSPSPAVTATGAPSTNQYNFLPSSQLQMTQTGEGATLVSSWVTVDTAGMSSAQDTSGKQWYRVRSTGRSALSAPGRVSANKLDNILRNTIGLNFSRNGGSTGGVTRTIEVIMQPLTSTIWVRGITAVNWLSLSGGMTIDSFDSSNSFKSTNGLYDAAKRQSHGDIATANSTGSDFRNTSVYGNVAYSGPAIKNTGNVHGTIATPGPATPTAVSAPSWPNGTYFSYSGGLPFTTTSGMTKSQIKVSGDLTVGGGQTLAIVAGKDPSNTPITNFTIWVTGKLTTSGSGIITQDTGISVTWYVGKDITISGSSYQNATGRASNLTVIGYGPTNSKATVSGSATFIGTINAPNYSATISGGGDFAGGIIANDLTMSGGSSFNYDESLNGGANTSVGNYAFASWFEDNADKAHNRSVYNNVTGQTALEQIVY